MSLDNYTESEENLKTAFSLYDENDINKIIV